jgi:Zn-dependent peptidase ImmA (M78 family)/DNA-binding XRE family transcriptional regulator
VSDESSSVASQFSPDRLRQARQLKGVSRAQVAKDANLSAAAVGQYENGTTRPKSTTVAGLALALGVPAAFFTQPRTEPTALPNAEHSFFRSLRSTSKRERERAAAYAALLAQLVNEIERHAALPPFTPIPELERDPNDPAEVGEVVADRARELWDLGNAPIKNVVRLMERQGIIVARSRMGEGLRVDAFSWIEPGSRPLVILGSAKDSYERSRFDAAHELGHLVMHAADPQPAELPMERQANRFASALLLPADAIRDEWPTGRLRWPELFKLKERWGVSLAALLYRSRDLGLLTPQAYQNAMKYLSRTWGRRVEPGPAYHPERPRLLANALALLDENGITLDELAERARLVNPDTLTKELELGTHRLTVHP